jgi:glutamine cyclotransferase
MQCGHPPHLVTSSIAVGCNAGSANIFFFDAVTLEERSDLRLTVRDAGVEVIRLNELEVVNGQLWANIWLTDRIAVIDLWSGEVVTWLDCSQTVKRIQVLDNR